MNIFPPNLSDFYKVSHKNQYPADAEVIYSNLTARSSRMEGVDKVIFFGLQAFIYEYLEDQFKTFFFCLHENIFERELANFKRRIDKALGRDNDVSHWRDLYYLGYLPLEIKALPEGSAVSLRVPLITIRNTHSDFFWLGQWMETLLSNVIWQPITSATISHEYKKLVTKYVKETSDSLESIPYLCHDFSMRGQTSVTSSMASGAAHLLSFYGTDTIPALNYLEDYYNCDNDNQIVGASIAATEHSVMTSMDEEGEFDLIKRLLTEVYPSGNVGIVADSFNIWRVLTEYLPKLKHIILNREGKAVWRPDSGVPEDILCGNPSSKSIHEQKGVVQLLWDVFGGDVNSKGYKELNEKVGVIYGDSITLTRCKTICERLKANGFAASNVVYGIGSFTFQYQTRDTFGLAFKATAIKRDGKWYSIFKNPITDTGMKKSARGLLMVKQPYIPRDDKNFHFDDYYLMENVTEEMERSSWNMLKPVYRDGKLLVNHTLTEIRNRIRNQ